MDQKSDPIDIIMRSDNDRMIIERTLEQLLIQDWPYRLFVIDSESTDGTRELAQHYAHEVIDIPAGMYAPGHILNEGMRATTSPIVVFLDSDCTPADNVWLSTLVDGFEMETECAARFGRQIPRLDCWPLFAKDIETTFGDGHRQALRKHCFSIGSSAIRRTVWEEMPFNDRLAHSEDVEWTWRAKQRGYTIRYIPESRVFHSHNYTLGQSYRRYRSRGLTEAQIFHWTTWEESLLRYTLLPLMHHVASDWKFCLRHFHLLSMFHSPLLRLAQAWGRHRGFQDGLRKMETMCPPERIAEAVREELETETENQTIEEVPAK